MKGFLKRDFYLVLPNLRFCLLFLLILAALSIFRVTNMMSFFGFYLALFAASSVLGLFSYDEMNHWQAYAAAVPDGRRGQVDGRYTLALLLGLVMSVLVALMSLLSGEARELPMALLYGGMFLIYIDLAIPVSYHFGPRSRTVMIIIVGVMAGLMGVCGATMTISNAGGTFHGTSLGLVAGAPFLAVGLVGMLLSRSVSLKILAGKEL